MRMIKRFVCAMSTPKEYCLIGIWAFSYNGIKRKIKKLQKQGYEIETRFGNQRFVKKFPKYLSSSYIFWVYEKKEEKWYGK